MIFPKLFLGVKSDRLLDAAASVSTISSSLVQFVKSLG
jgi:hypothetical protein